MSDSVKEKPRTAADGHRSKARHVAIRSSTESRDCTVRQLKWAVSGRLGASAEQLVLMHSGRVLRDTELLRHLKELNGSITLCMMERPQLKPSNDSASETIKSEHTVDLDPDPTLTPTPTSPLCLVQQQMENQLLGEPEMMHHVSGVPFVQSTLSNSSPQLTRQLLLSNPQIQQLLQTNSDVEDTENNTDVKNQRKKTQVVTTSGNPQTPEAQNNPKPSLSSASSDPVRELTATPRADFGSQGSITAGMQSLLEEITANPGLTESLLCGPYVSSLLNCLSCTPDLAAQMLLSHPLFSGSPQLQQQMRHQIPLLLQQMQSPELLSAMLNPRAIKALLQIQQGLQTLAAETPSLIPAAGLGISSVNEASEFSCVSAPKNQPENRHSVATVTEQQQQFVHQMLQALANTNSGVCHEEDRFKEELE